MEILKEALIETVKLLPILFLAYFVIEIIEYKYADKLQRQLQAVNKLAPVWGGLLGLFPQCGFSSLASALFAKKMIGYGAIIAVFISTSDEAIPILLANPSHFGAVSKLILIKIALAIICGFIIELVAKRQKISNIHGCTDHKCKSNLHHHNIEVDEIGCCGHEITDTKKNHRKILLHPIRHTLKIGIYIFLISAVIGYFFQLIPEDSVRLFLSNKNILQIILSAFFGLIPNCIASVTITNFYMSGLMNFPAMLSGLITSAGVGYIVLFKENKNLKENTSIVLIVLLIAITFGIILSVFAS